MPSIDLGATVEVRNPLVPPPSTTKWVWHYYRVINTTGTFMVISRFWGLLSHFSDR